MDSGQARRCAVARARRRYMGVAPQQRSEYVQAKGISVPCRRARVCVYCIGNHDNAALNGAIGTASALSRVIAHEETIAAPAAFTPAVAHCARRPRARVRSGISLVPQGGRISGGSTTRAPNRADAARSPALARACSNSTSSPRKLAGAGQSLQLGRERTADACVGGRRDRESGGAGGSAGHVGHGYGRAAACPGFGGHHDP
ncbi:hypothetical protein B0H11DRAFT_2277755 [Mycena galericulata]|nr:hypothetical protein B0H11DRAFT_2277755 [Mycena galericulata]